MGLQVAQNGKKAMLNVKPLAADCKFVVVHLPDGTTCQIALRKSGAITLPVTKVQAVSHRRPYELMVKTALPPGAVEPARWLRD